MNPLVEFSSSKNSLIENLVNADIVIGCETMAMVVALQANKKVISSIPPGGRKCMLPHDEIIHLCDIKNLNNII